MKFYINSDGHFKFDDGANNQLISSFLEHDVQNSLYGVDEYLCACDNVYNGKIPEWEGTGNAHTITIKKDSVRIYNEYTDEELIIDGIIKFKQILENWRKLILSKN